MFPLINLRLRHMQYAFLTDVNGALREETYMLSNELAGVDREASSGNMYTLLMQDN